MLIIVIKATIVFGLVKMLGYPLRATLLSGVLLSQIGEFSFVLASHGFKSNIITGFIYQSFIGASVLTFIFTPLLISAAYSLLDRRKISALSGDDRKSHSLHISNHVIICGMGLNGRNLVKVLKDTAINYVIIDLNFQTIKNQKGRVIKIPSGVMRPMVKYCGGQMLKLPELW
jgi:CPA2 family monovalent cation:H+ antiporter-2